MKNRTKVAMKPLLVCLLLSAVPAWAVSVGQPAPDFTLSSTDGKPVKLSDYRGKYVVLEWNNPHCPYVQKHYDSQNMQSLQKTYTGKGVVWLAVNSTNTVSSEYIKPADLGKWAKDKNAAMTALLMDGKSEVARAYNSQNTPAMYIVDPQGKVAYYGAIDDRRSANPDHVKTSKNYVSAALDESLAGKPITVATTRAYGCSIKYD
ncbi:thioredoxin family protein [Uliginosibacterium sp. H1]|uniref:thioredoxin family protein n=1 Tax=Uliginosibacterium sp. H1 TaxID=3114757 RepID=UPI002E19E5C0|nr:thioredoxin family protein [Uliginosibacterium sp. H1]